MSSKSGSTTSGKASLRCNVILPNGVALRVPIPKHAKIAELHNAVILRASDTIRGFQHTTHSTALKLGGRDAAYLWKGDSICDVVDDPENNTFVLAPLEDIHATPADLTLAQRQFHDYGDTSSSYLDCSTSSHNVMSLPSTSSGSGRIKVRWIVPETAMTVGATISSIPADPDPVPSDITLRTLNQLALGKLLSLSPFAGQLPGDLTATMFTKYCHISHPELKDTSITELGLVKSGHQRVNIFLVPTRNSSNIRDALGFRTSDRAFATFMTSLHLFIAKIGNDSHKLDNFMQVFLELTHFPPAAIALRQIIHDGNIQPQPCAIFAACFRELCLQVAPSKLYGSQDDVLLTSRHVFSWLSSLQYHTSKPTSTNQCVNIVELRKSDRLSKLCGPDNINFEEVVKIPALRLSSQDDLPSGSQDLQQLIVCKKRDDKVSSQMLALSLYEGSDATIGYYFKMPSETGSFGNHERRTLLDQSLFGDLLQEIHKDEVFRMVGPFHLSQTPSMLLPVATLDSAGYVSLYDQRAPECAEKYSFTWNIIRAQEKLPASEPGHYLFQKLDPLIIERKKAGTWELEEWEEAKAGSFGGQPYEAVVVCIDTSSSMMAPMPRGWFENYDAANNPGAELSRFNEVKEFFQNFVVRLNAYRVSTDVGLVTFASASLVQTHLSLTRVVLNFKDSIDAVRPYGSTALWDGVQKGCQMLVQHKTKYPAAKLRIIALTDGENNSSVSTPENVCAELCKHGIVLDAIVIGTNATEDLFKFAKHTGGYAFHPQNRTALFQIFLLENFIDIKTRPDIAQVPITDYKTSTPKVADLKTMFDCPPCRPHEHQNDHFIALKDAATVLRRATRPSVNPFTRIGHPDHAGSIASRSSSSASSRSSSTVSGATRVLHDQVQDAISKPHEFIDIYVSESNMGFWKVVMQGRPDTPYAKGVFLAYLEIGEDFPNKPPTMRFITPILHPNVSKHGRICHQIFDRSWSPDLSIMQILQHIWDILVLVESEDAIDPISAVRFYTDQASGEKLIDQYITRFALKTRAEHRLEICGPDGSEVPAHRPRRPFRLLPGRTSSVISLSTTVVSSNSGGGSQSSRYSWRRV